MNDNDYFDDLHNETTEDCDETLWPQCPNCGNEVHTSFTNDPTKNQCEECGYIFRDEDDWDEDDWDQGGCSCAKQSLGKGNEM